jgi:hypothetical protein
MIDSTLPWCVELKKKRNAIHVTLIYFFPVGGRWGLIIALMLASVSILFMGAFYAITGISFIVQPFLQMIGGFLHPGKPMANMFFVLFSYSESSCLTTRIRSKFGLRHIDSVKQAELLLGDLKFAQCMLVLRIPEFSPTEFDAHQTRKSLPAQRSQPSSQAR